MGFTDYTAPGRSSPESRRFAPGRAMAALLLILCASCVEAPQQPAPDPELEAMLGQMLLVGFRGSTLDTSEAILADIQAGRVGGVILFSSTTRDTPEIINIVGRDQVKALIAGLQAKARTPLFIAVDQEGGKISRLKPALGYPETPSHARLGALNDPAKTEETAALMGGWLRELGFTLDFAPVVDVNVNPDNPIIGRFERSFSKDPHVVALQAEAFAKGLRKAGVLSGIKHFPGHGGTRGDSHLGMADASRTWTRDELIPFARLVKEKACDMVMTAHIFNDQLDPAYPATLSKKTLTGVLRRDLGWDGVIITDDLQMRSISWVYSLETMLFLAVDAGVDILIVANAMAYEPDFPTRAIAALALMVQQNRIPRSRIEASYRRIMALKEKLSMANLGFPKHVGEPGASH